jgi:hypothetical protein
MRLGQWLPWTVLWQAEERSFKKRSSFTAGVSRPEARSRCCSGGSALLDCTAHEHVKHHQVENERKSETHQEANSDEVPHGLGVGRREAVRVTGLQMRARLGARDLEMVLQNVVHDLVGAKAGENQQVAQSPARTPRCGPDGAGLALLCPARLSMSHGRWAMQMPTAPRWNSGRPQGTLLGPEEQLRRGQGTACGGSSALGLPAAAHLERHGQDRHDADVSPDVLTLQVAHASEVRVLHEQLDGVRSRGAAGESVCFRRHGY